MEVLVYYYVCGLLSYALSWEHILLMLLSLEFMSIVVFFVIFCFFGLMVGHFYFLLFFLVVIVCEGALGLSLLVGVVRWFGSDMIYFYMV